MQLGNEDVVASRLGFGSRDLLKEEDSVNQTSWLQVSSWITGRVGALWGEYCIYIIEFMVTT